MRHPTPSSIARITALLLVCVAPSMSCAGCGLFPEPEISVEDYDVSCSMNADCVAITEGSVCDACTCSNAAINRSDEDLLQKDIDGIGRSCQPRTLLPCVPCQDVEPRCISGTCEVRPLVVRDTVGLAKACTSADDCVLVSVGQACAQCGCAREAVNTGVEGLTAYQDRYAGIQCGEPEILDCAACPPLDVMCVDGACAPVEVQP